VLEALVHETWKAESFETVADLAEAVKGTAGRLGIPYTGDAIAKAIRSVESRRFRRKDTV
jgi:hypothetical protein